MRVYNPEPEEMAGRSPHTIVEIVNDDMPFLVDSVTAAINDGDREVRLVIHPIITGRRATRAGGCAGSATAAMAGLRESWMQIEITRETDAAGLPR